MIGIARSSAWPALAMALVATPVALLPIPLPGAAGPVGFDDLRFSIDLGKVLVPAGRTGRVDLLDPVTHHVGEVAGFTRSRRARPGHDESTTSADAGQGLIFASDRTQRTIVVADARTQRIVARRKLGGSPDYVRWVRTAREVWVTEPEQEAIEIFRLSPTASAALVPAGRIDVADGPESLEIDPERQRAYTNSFHDRTIAIDLTSRRIVARWKNGCTRARGLSVDGRRGFVFVGCEEGKATLLDAVHDGRVVGSVPTGDGVDGIAYGSTLSHLYVPAAVAGNITIAGVRDDGSLHALGVVATARHAHCAAADDLGNVYVCDPDGGRLLTFRDPFPQSR